MPFSRSHRPPQSHAPSLSKIVELRRRWIRRTILLLSLAYLMILGALSWANAAGPERWGWSCLNLYLPQWIWAIPGVALLAGAVLRARRWVWLPLIGLGWVIGPLMGLRWNHAPEEKTARGVPIRVMTYNVEWGRRNYSGVLDEIVLNQPDLLLLQDAGSSFPDALKALLSGWNCRSTEQYFIASRWPILSVQERPLPLLGHPRASSYLRCRLKVGEESIVVYNAHLLTPRRGLVALKEGQGGVSELMINSQIRLQQALVLASALKEEKGPVLLAGDLNAPEPAQTCQALIKTGLRDAFSEAGRGYGYTFGHRTRLRHSFLRIDHILVGRHFVVRRCRTGNAAGSDHRPVIADLSLIIPEGRGALSGPGVGFQAEGTAQDSDGVAHR